MSLELYERILDQIGDYLFQCQIFGQGEPLMNWRLTRSIIERTHQRRIFSYLSTNCTLLTPDIAEELAGCGLDYLVCAIDGTSQESYQVYRAGGQIDDALAGLRHIVAARRRQRSRLQIEWQFLVHARNEHEIPAAQRLAREFGVHLRLAPLRGMEWDPVLEEYWLPKAGPWAQTFEPGRPLNDFPCYFLWRSLVLNSNGKIARCLVYQNASQYADLAISPIMSAYNHSSVQLARRLFRKEPLDEEELPIPCRSCGQFARHHGAKSIDRNSDVRLSSAAAD